ncbi:hypothetical protein LA080_003933 [Diaporthe eres]|nr:hypothetical protein LA080_003933 [Diaporthe eres]
MQGQILLNLMDCILPRVTGRRRGECLGLKVDLPRVIRYGAVCRPFSISAGKKTNNTTSGHCSFDTGSLWIGFRYQASLAFDHFSPEDSS